MSKPLQIIMNRIGKLIQWKIRVTTPDGQPIEGAKITVDGDMPQHGHSLPTRPQVTRSLGDGTYLVEGMKFQMGGWWVADFTITDATRTNSRHGEAMLANARKQTRPD